MRRITQEKTEDAVDELDRLIASAYGAKECFRKRQYEDAAGYPDDAAAARKKAAELINEMWE